jgi:diguanylate cyclase (GGDEF)-like protein
MKISGAVNQPYAPLGRRGASALAAPATAAAAAADEASFLGISEAELTPAVRAALGMLVVELEDLRAEVRRLKARVLEAEAAADEDPLTAARNRRAFIRELTRTLGMVRRYGAPAALIYLDLDDFKHVNDRFGHAAGDAALRAVAERLRAHVRESDVVGRLGGDEFAVLLLQADRRAGEAKAAALAGVIEAEPVRAGEHEVDLRVSYGVRELAAGMAPETALAEADAAMFVMKRGGA